MGYRYVKSKPAFQGDESVRNEISISIAGMPRFMHGESSLIGHKNKKQDEDQCQAQTYKQIQDIKELEVNKTYSIGWKICRKPPIKNKNKRYQKPQFQSLWYQAQQSDNTKQNDFPEWYG